MDRIVQVLINAAALYVAVLLVPGLDFDFGPPDAWWKFLLVALIFALVNTFLKPVLRWKMLLNVPRQGAEYPRGVLLKTWPMISLAFVSGAAGEALGYIFGAWRAPVRLTEYEVGYDRSRS